MTQAENIRALIEYRVGQAGEALREAVLLQEAGHFRGAINRAYYAMFYAVQALIIRSQEKISKHSGAIAFFDKNYIKTGIFGKDFSKWLHQVFDLRQDADYGTMSTPSAIDTAEALAHATEFVRSVGTIALEEKA